MIVPIPLNTQTSSKTA